MHCSELRWHEPPGQALRALPLLTLYLSERCNSRCISCDWWRSGQRDFSVQMLERQLPALRRLGTEVVMLSGGEPLLHPEWMHIATLLRRHGIRPWLLSSGLAVAKHAAEIAHLFDSVTVSLDAADAARYARIRGVDGFEAVCRGVSAMAELGRPVSVRTTVQSANYRELPQIARLARLLGAASISFLAADVGAGSAFGRHGEASPEIALGHEDLPVLEAVLEELAEFEADGFVLESRAKLQRLAAYFRALLGEGEFPPVRCNAPEFSAVMEADGALRPCFFIPGSQLGVEEPLDERLNSVQQTSLRADIRAGQRPECRTCVCSMWRENARF
ncbi:MAG: radical SAM protein [Paucibacter sp.]|nr:radical SAM protein [Roseateles sp.]